jgi:hypothetical protein
VSNGRVIRELEKIGHSGHGCIKVITLAFAWRDCGKSCKASVTKASVLDKNLTKFLQNKSFNVNATPSSPVT